jgi:hypothetical protein
VGLINTTSGVRQYTVASGLSTGTHDDDDHHHHRPVLTRGR